MRQDHATALQPGGPEQDPVPARQKKFIHQEFFEKTNKINRLLARLTKKMDPNKYNQKDNDNATHGNTRYSEYYGKLYAHKF